MYRRRAAGFTNTHPNAREQQPTKGLRGAGHHGHAAPDQNSQGDDVLSITHIRPTRNGNASKCIKQRKRDTTEQSELGVTELYLLLYRFDKNRENLAIDKINNIDQ